MAAWARTGPLKVGRLPVAGLGLQLLARLLALAAAVAVVLGAALFLARSVGHFWQVVGPIYRARGIASRLDFSWFFYGMQTAWLHADPVHRLYSIPAQDRWMEQNRFPYDHADVFGYPPPFALLWAPLAALPYAAARQLWTQINLAALGIGLAVAAWQASPRFGLARWMLLVGGALWAHTLQSNFYWGQPNALILALVALGLAGVVRKRPSTWSAALGGVALGLAAVLKLTPVILLCYLPLRWALGRSTARGRAAGVGALAGWATVAATCAAAGVVLGWGTLPTYVWQAIPEVERSAWAHGPAPWNQSLRGILMVFSHNQAWLDHAAGLFGAAVFLAVVGLVALRPRLDPRLEAAAAGLLVLLASPSLEDHHFTVALLPWILVGGYLLDALADWRRAWLWPLAAVFAVATVALVAPGRLHWPPALLPRPVAIPLPPGRYERLYVLGAASYGPVRFQLRLQYRDAPPDRVAATWPDWWSPGNPLPAAIAGVAEDGGRVHNPHVGLYLFEYPVRADATLVALELPGALPQQNGGPEGLHLVAATLERAGGGAFVPVALPFNARGIASGPRAGVRAADSFDGVGNLFWTPAWPGGDFRVFRGGVAVPLALPDPAAAANVLNVPPPATAAGPRWLRVVLGSAPSFVGIACLFLAACLAGALAPAVGPAGRRAA